MIRYFFAAALILLSAPTLTSAQRLPGGVVPERYVLWFAPDFETDTFRGRATIHVQVQKPSDAITLHAAEITFSSVQVRAGGSAQAAAVTLDEKSETATLKLPAGIPAGPAAIEIAYTGILNDKLRGFYLSKANGREYAVTQLQATDARRAFPSFDEPQYKATFEISLMVDTGDTAISNGAQVSDTPGPEPGKHTVTFAPTAKMSTYLVALLVGDFVCREGGADGVPIRVCATPDKLPLTAFALEAAQQQLSFYNAYYGIKYPFGKLDVLAVPDFAAGAMENTGAVTFRERLLLADANRASLTVLKNIASVLSHEIAHMWFGNLVTMKWWDDIWLNEGFATWMANKPLAVWKPEWQVSLDDVEDTQRALTLDALRTTRAIRTKVETPEEINEVFDAIAYEKSAGVIRMVENYVGPDVFRKAVTSYLNKFAYGNAAAEDFWSEVARVSGRPVDAIMKSYVDQPGVPVLSVRSECKGSHTEVRVAQERFVGTPGAAAPAPQTWTIPLCFKASPDSPGSCDIVSQQAQTLKIQGCAAEAFVNANARGYFYTEYTPQTVRALARKARGTLTPEERVGLVGDEWWMVRSGRHDAGVFFDLAGALSRDEVPAVVQGIATRLAFARASMVAAPQRPAFENWIRRRFAPALTALGLPGDMKDSDARQSRRAALLSLVGVTGNSPDVQRTARALAARYLDDPASLPGTLAPVVLQAAAVNGDAALYERYLARLEATTSNPEEYYRFFNALAAFENAALVKRTLEFALSPKVRAQDAGVLIEAVLARDAGRGGAWPFVKAEWARVVAKLGDYQIPGIASALGSFCSADAAADVKAFFAAHPAPSAERTLRQSLERVESCAAVAARQGPAVAAWLATAGTQ